MFQHGFGGFPIDENGNNLIGCNKGPNEVLHLGEADFGSVPAPIITYFTDNSGHPVVGFDFDGDGHVDATTSTCHTGFLQSCGGGG